MQQGHYPTHTPTKVHALLAFPINLNLIDFSVDVTMSPFESQFYLTVKLEAHIRTYNLIISKGKTLMYLFSMENSIVTSLEIL